MTRNITSWIKTRMLAGVIVLTPLVITLWIFHTLFVKLDNILGVLMKRFVGRHIPGTGFVGLILLTLLVGALARNLVGWKLISMGNMILARIPFVSKIYRAIQQITHVFIGEKKGIFQRVVLVQFPQKGSYILGFVTATHSGAVGARIGEKYINVFIPTTPNPTSGFLLFASEEDVTTLDMSVEEGLKMVVSGGAYVPEYRARAALGQEGEP